MKKVLRSLVPKVNRHVLEKGILANLYSLDDISRLVQGTAPETIQGYFMWRTIAATQQNVIAPGIFDRWEELRRTLATVPIPKPPANRSRFCLEYISRGDGLDWLTGRFTLGNFLQAHEKELAHQIVNDLHDAYEEKLRSLS